MIGSLFSRRELVPDDRVVLVTGAGQGIGRELARQLHRRNAKVVLVDLDGAAIADLATRLDGRALAVTADVTDRDAMAAAIAQAVDRFGSLDIVVANAGIVPRPATLRTIAPERFDRVLDVNLTGVFNTVHPALDHVIAARGHVVVVSSCAAFAPGMGGAPYMISKAAVEQLGRALRVELSAHGATAGIAYFGIVETAMTHDTLDDDELGRRVGNMLPWPLNIRISATEAARVVVDGITHRSAATYAPIGWIPYSMLRGAINTVLDAALAADSGVHDLVRKVEERSGGR